MKCSWGKCLSWWSTCFSFSGFLWSAACRPPKNGEQKVFVLCRYVLFWGFWSRLVFELPFSSICWFDQETNQITQSPNVIVSFLMFCFILLTSTLIPHNNLVLLYWKQGRSMTNKSRRRLMKTHGKSKKRCRLVYLFWEGFVLGSIFISLFHLLFMSHFCFADLNFYIFCLHFSFGCVFFAWHQYVDSTPPGFLTFENSNFKWKENRKCFWKKVGFFFGGGGSLLGSDLQVVCVWCVSSLLAFIFSLFGLFPVSSCLPCCKSTPPPQTKAKTNWKEDAFKWVLVVLFCCESVSCNPKRKPHQTTKH